MCIRDSYYFDVATAHLYFQPNGVYNVLYAFRQVMDDRGLAHPLWLVETNAPPMNDPYWVVDNWTLAVDLNEQAAFIPQSIAAALAAGAERVAVYKLKDTAGDRAANPEPFGLIRWDESRRPAFDAYRVAIRLMAGTTAATRERWDGVGQVRLSQPGQTTTVLFTRLPDGQTARVAATADEAELIDMWGERETITAEAGVFTVELPGALCLQTIADYCMIGGTTYYLIQADDGRPPATVSRPTEESATTATPRPLATTAPSPTNEPTITPSPTTAPTSVSYTHLDVYKRQVLGPADAAGPGRAVGPLLGRELPARHHIRHGHAPTRPQHAVRLAEDGRLIGAKIDDAVGQNHVHRVIGHGQGLDEAVAKFDVG